MQIEKIYIHTHRSFPLCVCVCVFVYDSVQHHSGSTASVITNSLTVLLGRTHKILLSYNQQNILKNVYKFKKNLTKKSCCCSKNNATDLICWCSLSANICCLSHLLSWDKDVVICVCVCVFVWFRVFYVSLKHPCSPSVSLHPSLLSALCSQTEAVKVAFVGGRRLPRQGFGHAEQL